METNSFRSRTPEELAQFYSDLFVLDVDIKKGGSFSVENTPTFVVSVYKNQNGAIIGAMILDIPAAASFSGALSDLPEDLIQGIIQSSEFTKEMWEDLYEVLNISSQLFTSYDGDTIAIEEVYHYPKSLPPEAYEILIETPNPLIFQIDISEYGGGYIAVLDAQNNSVFAEEDPEHTIVPQTKQEFSEFESIEKAIPERPLEPVLQEEPTFEEDIAPQIQYLSTGSSSPPWLYLGIGLVLGGVIGAGAFKLANPQNELSPDIMGIPLSPTKTQKKFAFPDTIKQVRLESATFTMGCNREFSEDCGEDEWDPHMVTLPNDFYIMKHEVTQELYEAIMKRNPSRFLDCEPSCPVENVSWKDAVVFANTLSQYHSLETCYNIDGEKVTLKNGTDCLGYRLPTEAEWEYAARGPEGQTKVPINRGKHIPLKKGEKVDVAQYSGSQNPSEVAWYGGYDVIKQDNLGRDVGVGKSSTHPVCKKKENGFGLCDMSGNVWEWTEDTYQNNFYKLRSSRYNPIGSPKGRSRVLRGGSWLSSTVELRTSHRFYASESTVDTLVPMVGSFGFRLVRTAPETKDLPQKEPNEANKTK